MHRPTRNVTHVESELYPQREFKHKEVDGLAICQQCHAIHDDKHWRFDDARASTLLEQAETHRVTCPGCLAVRHRRADGILSLRGKGALRRADEILNLLHAEAHREMRKNPLGRIIGVETTPDGLEVATTTRFLAQDLGRRLHHAMGGDLTTSRLPRAPFVRVTWYSAPADE